MYEQYSEELTKEIKNNNPYYTCTDIDQKLASYVKLNLVEQPKFIMNITADLL